MSEHKPKLVVRHGKHEDKQAVLDIDTNVYAGMDYLSVRYDSFCDDKWRINYILEADGIPVAYFVATVVDEGEAVLFQAARTHPEHRKLGYYNYLKKEAAKELKTLYPKLREILFTAGSSTPNDTQLYSIGEGRKILFAKRMYYFNLTGPEIQAKVRLALAERKETLSRVQEIPFNKVNEFLQKDDFRKQFQGDRALIDWVPYKLGIASNMSLPCRFPDNFVVSYANDDVIDGVSFHITFKDGGPRDWERHDLEMYCHSKDAYLKHHMFFMQSMMENREFNNVHGITLVPEHLGNPDLESSMTAAAGVSVEPIPDFPDLFYVPLVSDTGYFQDD